MRQRKQIVVCAIACLIVPAFLFAALAAEKAAEKPAGPPKPGPETKKLEYFVGNWNTKGELKPNAFGAPSGSYASEDSCKWFEGGFALICRSSGKGPMGPVKSVYMLGYNAEEKVYTYYGIDNGPMVPASVPKGTIEGDTWTYLDESKMGGKLVKSRYVIKTSSPGAYAFQWETQGDDGKWTTVLEGKSTKSEAAAKGEKGSKGAK